MSTFVYACAKQATGTSGPHARLSTILNLPVEFFNPLAGVTVSKGMDVERLQREAHMMGELDGLGLRGIANLSRRIARSDPA